LHNRNGSKCNSLKMLNGKKERGGQRLSMHYHHRMTKYLVDQRTYHEMKKSLRIDVDKLIKHLNKKWQYYWEPFRNITVDESLIPTKTRCPHPVIIRRKPHPVGVKLWSNVDREQFLYGVSLYKCIAGGTKEATTATLLWMVSYLPGGHHFII